LLQSAFRARHRRPLMLRLRSAVTALLTGLAFLASARPAPAAIVLLADGRTLTGVELKAGPSPAQVQLVGGSGGSVTVAKDEVLLANGDRVSGEITDIKENRVLLRVNDVPATLELSRVKAIGFGRAEPPAAASSGLQVALDLGGGERITARWIGLEGENL